MRHAATECNTRGSSRADFRQGSDGLSCDRRRQVDERGLAGPQCTFEGKAKLLRPLNVLTVTIHELEHPVVALVRQYLNGSVRPFHIELALQGFGQSEHHDVVRQLRDFWV